MMVELTARFRIGKGAGAGVPGGAIVSTSFGGSSPLSPGLGGGLLGQPVGGSFHRGATPPQESPVHATPLYRRHHHHLGVLESRQGAPTHQRWQGRQQRSHDPYTTLGPDDYRLTDKGPSDRNVTTGKNFTPGNSVALRASAARIGTTPQDLAKVIAYETEGSFSPSKWGGKGGRHVGLIQFGPSERRQYGATPNQSFSQQLGAVERYLKDRGFRPGMGLSDLYSTILAGRPGLYNRRDSGGSVSQHVARMQRDRAAQAGRFLGAGDAAAHWLGGEPPEAARFTGAPPATGSQSVIPGQRDPHKPGFDPKSVSFLGEKAGP